MRARKEIRTDTHINFDVEVLEVERVFPDIDTDDGDMSEERILVSSGDNLEDFVARVQTLMDGWSDQAQSRLLLESVKCRRL
jgi:hypothetical protein